MSQIEIVASAEADTAADVAADGSAEVLVEALEQLACGVSLDRDLAARVMHAVMGGRVAAAQLGALLLALRVKGETVEEIAGFAEAMRAHSVPVMANRSTVDTCGTGGDGSGTFNVSTVAAFVAAGAGAAVAKHGNRAMSSSCGSADVLEALGVVIDLGPIDVATMLDDIGLGFMFAPRYHPAMRHAASVRKELGVRTVFNVLGPLLNPARTQHQVLGVARSGLAPKLASVLRELGTKRALVVHGTDGIDELSLAGTSIVHELVDGRLRLYEVVPEDVGLRRAPLEALRGGSREENAAIARSILEGEQGARRDVVVLNAGGALLAAGIASSLGEGVELAQRSIDEGAALDRLEMFVAATQRAAIEAERAS